MNPAGHVVVVGSINVDFVVAVPRLPSEGETVGSGVFARRWGGKGANQAFAAARYGAQVHMIGAVGDEDLGAAAVAELAAAGVDVAGVAVERDAATGVASILVDKVGRNIIAVAPGANAVIDPAAVAGGTFAGQADVVLTCFEVEDPVVLAAVRFGLGQGAVVIVNPAPARPLPRELEGSGVILTPNEHEATELTGVADPVAAATRLSTWTDGTVVVTLGRRGAAICSRGALVQEVTAPRVSPLDTTGAGDAFNGTLAAALAEGKNLASAVRRAVAAASLSVRGLGARGAVPSRQELETYVVRGESADDVLGEMSS